MGMETPLRHDIDQGIYCVDLPNGFKLAWFCSVGKYGLYDPDYLWLRTLDDEQEAFELAVGLSGSKHKAFCEFTGLTPTEAGAPKEPGNG